MTAAGKAGDTYTRPSEEIVYETPENDHVREDDDYYNR